MSLHDKSVYGKKKPFLVQEQQLANPSVPQLTGPRLPHSALATLLDLPFPTMPAAPGHLLLLFSVPECPSLGSSQGHLLLIQASAEVLQGVLP